jgi:serine/threonine-protein kinase
MSPEQAVADPLVDHRADIYSVGALGYELLTGRQPFSGMTPQQVLAAHISVTPEHVSVHRATVPPALAAVIMKCLEKRPGDRWQSADELVAQLEAIATPSGSMQPSAAIRVPARPLNRRLIAGVVTVALLLAGG